MKTTILGDKRITKEVRDVRVFHLSDISILVQVDTKIKWPQISFGSGWENGIASKHILIRKSNRSSLLCTVELYPDNDWEKNLLDAAWSGLLSSRYGPLVVYTMIPLSPDIIGRWTKEEGRTATVYAAG